MLKLTKQPVGKMCCDVHFVYFWLVIWSPKRIDVYGAKNTASLLFCDKDYQYHDLYMKLRDPVLVDSSEIHV